MMPPPLAAEHGLLGTYQTAGIELSEFVFQQFGNFLPDAFAPGRNLAGSMTSSRRSKCSEKIRR